MTHDTSLTSWYPVTGVRVRPAPAGRAQEAHIHHTSHIITDTPWYPVTGIWLCPASAGRAQEASLAAAQLFEGSDRGHPLHGLGSVNQEGAADARHRFNS